MRNIEVIFKAINMLYKYDMYDFLSEEDHKKIAKILLDIIKRYNKEDITDIEDDLGIKFSEIDDDWG